jgi:hypothetical protein
MLVLNGTVGTGCRACFLQELASINEKIINKEIRIIDL